MGHVSSKTRSLGQILEKPYVRSSGHIFSPIIMKLGQYVCLGEISDKCENGSCQVKNNVTRSNLGKNLVHAPEATFSVRLSLNLVRMFVLIKSQTNFTMGHVESKTRSLSQILEKHVYDLEATFSVRLS